MVFSRIRPLWLAGIHALLLTFAACRSGEGQNRISSPSSSAQSARRGGVFLSTVKLVNGEAGPRGDHFRLDEAWLEEVVERFEAIPLRRRVSGTRLCVRMTRAAKDLPASALDAQIHFEAPEKAAVTRDGSVFFRGVVIISFKVDAGCVFPKAGTISIDDLRTAENVAVFAFSVIDENHAEGKHVEGNDRHNP